MSKYFDKSKEIIEHLEQIGLSNKEARVYLALLPYKDVGTSFLMRSTNLHGQFVYNALDRLEKFGLVQHVIKNGRKKFTANPPKRILSILDEKRLSAQTIVRQLEEKFAGRHEQDFTIYQDETAFVNRQRELLEITPEDSDMYVIASGTDKYMSILELHGVADEFDHLRKMKRIHVYYIGAESVKERLDKYERERAFWTHRTLPGQALGKMSIEIWPNCVDFVVYGEPVLIFSLNSKDVSDGYREFFNTLWNLAR